jgi:hypothetical protein
VLDSSAATRVGALSGIVAGVAFLGDRVRIVVDGAAPKRIIVESDSRREFRAGDRVTFRIEPDRILSVRES